MSMQSESLEVLEKANVPAAQARAIVRAIEIEIDGARDTLATKQDLQLLRQDLREEIAHTRRALETQMEGLRGALEVKFEGVRTEIYRSGRALAIQMYGALLAQMSVLVGIVYFLTTHPSR